MASHGRYTILGKLADGGMAEIFLAVQHGAEGFEKRIVLKRILTQYSADPQFRNMLLDEAHISMSLQHSNIAQVQDLGVAGGRYFMALELVDGWDLEKVVQRAFASGMVWPAALSLYVIACVCRALAYAHAKSRDGKPLGIVHRDISPNNVLISDQGEVKLTDFGIAKAQRKREQTAAGVIKGKVAYMSPEQALGATIDKRSDIFSVGSMLYRMVTDKLPFEAADDMEQLVRVQKAQFTPPEQAKPTISPSVSGIITRALRLQPAERYQTADEMLADVERVLRNEFHSAGQTELKLWLEQLGRRDDAPTIGKRRLDTSGIVKDEMGTDLSAGTSFELDDLDKGSAPTEYAMPSRPDVVAAAAKPPPLPRPLGGSTAQIASARAPGRRRSGFWLGVIFALAAVVGIRYALDWAKQKDVAGKLGLSQDAADKAPVAQPTAPPQPSGGEGAQPKPPTPAAGAGTGGAAETAQAHPGPEAPAPAAPAGADGVPDARAEPAPTGAQDKDRPPVVAKAPDDDDTDEEALLRDAVPDAESAVIGEDEAETAPPPKGTAAKPAAGAKPKPPAAKAATTAILHITSAPAGAVVRTKARVLGRTPIKLHFKTGNTYEIMLLKKGYQPATRRVAVANAKARKVAVALKKRASPKRASKPFFKPHR